jgi:hypothetical protein
MSLDYVALTVTVIVSGLPSFSTLGFVKYNEPIAGRLPSAGFSSRYFLVPGVSFSLWKMTLMGSKVLSPLVVNWY